MDETHWVNLVLLTVHQHECYIEWDQTPINSGHFKITGPDDKQIELIPKLKHLMTL